ncbi:MAG: UDP-3-O-(3-hydroxymyristoyl)glucosamine N-acyltransferase, partial [Gemmatimonadetes bacterium]|nr:UDP-3-O-(3-hydroxymyristoyl)glucosamine N-acyltransferase [Gemmatimonadota bacterium]
MRDGTADWGGRVWLTVAEAAALAGGQVMGDRSARLCDVLPLAEAEPEHLGFLAERKYLEYLPATRAAALLVPEELGSETEGFATRIIVRDPRLALLELLKRFHPPVPASAGIHATAVLGRSVEIGDAVRVDAYSVVGDGARIGARTRIGAHVVIGERCRIGRDVVVHPHVTLYPEVALGDRVIVHSGVRLGVDGYGYVFHDGEHRKIPQVGRCVVHDDVEIGANACVDRGSIGSTDIGAGTKIDNLVHIGHNVSVGSRALLVAQVGIAGSSTIGDGAILGGQAGISGHLAVGAGARVGAQAGVIGDVEPGSTVSGYPARPHREAMRALGWMFRLPKLLPGLT